ncbi:hypothetical protein AB0N05_24210 [Nocardia sp. NPDC051030]|uniref:hypothetical protein n=1 Tax=Nocardia sp. NPDC051030 TaxID=3155162 RepID=UPI00342FB7C1
MRARVIALTATVSGAVIAGAIAAGTAAAVTPVGYPQYGTYGVELSHGETQALANSPIPALADRFFPGPVISVGTAPGSTLPQDDYHVFAGLPDVVGEAAAHPGGTVDIYADSQGVMVIQDW